MSPSERRTLRRFSSAVFVGQPFVGVFDDVAIALAQEIFP